MVTRCSSASLEPSEAAAVSQLLPSRTCLQRPFQNLQEVHVPELEGVWRPEASPLGVLLAAPPVVTWRWRVVLQLHRPDKRGSSPAREPGELIKVTGSAQMRYTLVNTGGFTGTAGTSAASLVR